MESPHPVIEIETQGLLYYISPPMRPILSNKNHIFQIA